MLKSALLFCSFSTAILSGGSSCTLAAVTTQQMAPAVRQTDLLSSALSPNRPIPGKTPDADIIVNLQRIESTIKYDEPANPYFGYIEGTIPVIISAPHGAKHYRTRESRLKAEDAYTAAMALKLAEMTGAHVMYVRNRAFEDPNNDYHTQYKDFLARVIGENHIRFVMDLHGSHRGRAFSVDVGTFSQSPDNCSCPQTLKIISKALEGLEGVTFNRRFTAHGRGTVTYFARKHLGIEAAHFEINARYRIPTVTQNSPQTTVNSEEIDSVLRALRSVVLAVATNGSN